MLKTALPRIRPGSYAWAPIATISRSAAAEPCLRLIEEHPGLDVTWVVFTSNPARAKEAESGQSFLPAWKARRNVDHQGLPRRIPALRRRPGQGRVRGPEAPGQTRSHPHPLPPGPAPGPPAGIGTHLEHLARPSDLGIRNPQVRRRHGDPQRLRGARRGDGAPEGPGHPQGLPVPIGQAVDGRGDLPLPDAPCAASRAMPPAVTPRASIAAR